MSDTSSPGVHCGGANQTHSILRIILIASCFVGYINHIVQWIETFCLFQARNKPADGGGHVNQKGATGQKSSTPAAKASQTPVKKPPTAQKGQVKQTQVKPAPPPVKAVNKKNKKGQRHQQHDLVVTINLVSLYWLSHGQWCNSFIIKIQCNLSSFCVNEPSVYSPLDSNHK